jgi:hypothetical protein
VTDQRERAVTISASDRVPGELHAISDNRVVARSQQAYDLS